MKLVTFSQLCCLFALSTAYVVYDGASEAEIAKYAPTDTELGSFMEAHNFSIFHPLEIIVGLMKDLTRNYSRIAKLERIGKSYENRPIYNMKISSGRSSSKPVIIIECGIHSNEWISVATGSFIAYKLVTSYGSNQEITDLVDDYEFNILINMNPDGYVYAWAGTRDWRKSRSHNPNDWTDSCRGVDLNRNFDIWHGAGKEHKSTCSSKYCGHKPFSESESRALRDLMIAKKDRISVYIALHTDRMGDILTPYGFSDGLRPPKWEEDLMPVARAGADAIKKFSGKTYNVNNYAAGFNVHNGMSVDYLVYKLKVKYAFVMEIRSVGYDDMDEEILEPLCQEAWEGIKGMIDERSKRE